jgi:two-component system KDP operon response regulator KdpE
LKEGVAWWEGLTMKALLIEDNQEAIKNITFYLQVRYPEVIIISSGEVQRCVEMVETESPDLVILDCSLPGSDTLDLVSKIREFSEVSLIIISESESDVDIARWLEGGADEYIIKPLNPIEFLARVKALLRRSQGDGYKHELPVSFSNGLTINFATREVFLLGKQIKLTPTEYRLLSELVRNNGRVLTHRCLLEKVWGSEYASDTSFIKKYICRLRRKLQDDSDNPQMIQTERGVGYRFR